MHIVRITIVLRANYIVIAYYSVFNFLQWIKSKYVMKQESKDFTYSHKNQLILIWKLVHLICIGENDCNVFGKSISFFIIGIILDFWVK